MIETIYGFSVDRDERLIEKVLTDDMLQYIHMTFPAGEGLPEHRANATVYMSVLRGALSIRLGEQAEREYGAGTLLKIPFDTKMRVQNARAGTLELLVIKAPAPRG